ncbi:MAG: CvpA family protein [Bacilli bacterium]
MGIIDTAIIILLGVLVFLGLLKGFVRQIFSMGAWILALAIPIIFGKTITNIFSDQIPDTALGKSSLVFIGLFLLTFIIVKVLGHIFSKSVKKGALGWVDRFLGMVWGATKGLVIISVVLLLAKALTTLPLIGEEVLGFLSNDLKLGTEGFLPGKFLYENNLLVKFIESLK